MNKKISIILTLSLLISLSIFLIYRWNTPTKKYEQLEVTQGLFRRTLSAPGSIEPENKIDIKPPVSGRLDRILIKEGDFVRDGQIIAWMSSTDRAALLDAAKAQGAEELKRWQEMYLPTPIMAPSKGQIIRFNVVKGQSIEAGTTLFELSDRLIVRSRVDESDIAQLHTGQMADVLFDALDDEKITAKISRISYSATTKDNLTTYEIILEPLEKLQSMRSGLSVTVNYLIEEKQQTILVPAWVAQGKENAKVDVLIKDGKGKPSPRTIEIGKSNGEFVEVLGQLSVGEILMYEPVQIVGGKKRGPLGF